MQMGASKLVQDQAEIRSEDLYVLPTPKRNGWLMAPESYCMSYRRTMKFACTYTAHLLGTYALSTQTVRATRPD